MKYYIVDLDNALVFYTNEKEDLSYFRDNPDYLLIDNEKKIVVDDLGEQMDVIEEFVS